MGTYVFDQAWQRERERLRGLEDLFDASSVRHLAALGVGPGWRRWEVGCGGGSLALWLANRVGSTGRVLATDLEPRFLHGHGRANLDARKHDLLRDPIEEASFDLAHARAVLEHIPDRRAALARMVAAVRPGGWVVVEDVDFGGAMGAALARYVHPCEHAALYERVVRGVEALFRAAGADASFGARLPGELARAGLERVGAEAHGRVVSGCAAPGWVALTIEHLRPRLLAPGW